MTSKIIDYIEKFVPLNAEEGQLVTACFKEVKVKKRQFIVQPNFTAKHRHYISKGAFTWEIMKFGSTMGYLVD